MSSNSLARAAERTDETLLDEVQPVTSNSSRTGLYDKDFKTSASPVCVNWFLLGGREREREHKICKFTNTQSLPEVYLSYSSFD